MLMLIPLLVCNFNIKNQIVWVTKQRPRELQAVYRKTCKANNGGCKHEEAIVTQSFRK